MPSEVKSKLLQLLKEECGFEGDIEVEVLDDKPNSTVFSVVVLGRSFWISMNNDTGALKHLKPLIDYMKNN